MHGVALREHVSGEIAKLEGRLRDLAPESAAARAPLGRRPGVEAWLAFSLLAMIVAGAGVWLGVAARAIRPPPNACVDL